MTKQKHPSLVALMSKRQLGKPVRDITRVVRVQSKITRLVNANAQLQQMKSNRQRTPAFLEQLQNAEQRYARNILHTRKAIKQIPHWGLKGKTWKDYNKAMGVKNPRP